MPSSEPTRPSRQVTVTAADIELVAPVVMAGQSTQLLVDELVLEMLVDKHGTYSGTVSAALADIIEEVQRDAATPA